MTALKRFLFDQPAPEYIDAYYLPPPDAELRERNAARAKAIIEAMGDKYCLRPQRKDETK